MKQGYQSSIDKFKLEDENGNDITEQILHLPKVYLIFSYKPKEVSLGAHPSEEIQEKLEMVAGKSPIYEISTEKSDLLGFQHLTMDGTAIKTIARSNPFVLILENGKIVDKKSLEDFLKH